MSRLRTCGAERLAGGLLLRHRDTDAVIGFDSGADRGGNGNCVSLPDRLRNGHTFRVGAAGFADHSPDTNASGHT